MPVLTCRLCGAALQRTFVDLGMAPPCEAILPPERLESPEVSYPLHVRTCEQCLLVQLPAHLAADEVFTPDYAYYSSYSSSWVEHARQYTMRMTEQLPLRPDDLIVEVASNDGYLLQHFVASDHRVLGVEPCAGVAAAARERGVPTEECFLGEKTGRLIAEEHGRAALVVANNVLAHVPDLADFVRGLRELLDDAGTLTLEFPHLARLVEQRQFDTIYHEHYSYFTLLTAKRALAVAGLEVVDVEELPTHGGSLRVHARHAGRSGPGPAVDRVLAAERAAGLHSVEGHDGFSAAVLEVKRGLLAFLLGASERGEVVVGYGAPGKGNTLLNHCGVRSDLLAFTVDRNPHKHGMFLPGSHIPVLAPEALDAARPDYVLVLPWNLRAELEVQLRHVQDWGGRLVFPVPHLEVVGGSS